MAEVAYVATVQLLVRAKGPADACDGISELLSGAVEGPGGAFLVDWGYLRVGGQQLGPTETLIDPETYEEGAFLG